MVAVQSHFCGELYRQHLLRQERWVAILGERTRWSGWLPVLLDTATSISSQSFIEVRTNTARQKLKKTYYPQTQATGSG